MSVRALLSLPLLVACTGDVVEAPAVAPPPPPPPVDPGLPDGPPQPAPPQRPPQIRSAIFDPPVPTAQQEVRIKVDAIDPDSEFVELEYLWQINGRPNPALRRDRLKAGDLRKGDEVSVEITARDLDGNESKMTPPTFKVANAPPEFTSDPRLVSQIDGTKLEARDPDQELLTYTVSGGPAGLTVDGRTGVLRYVGSKDEPGGHYAIVVKVDDGDGGTAEWRLEADISPGSAAAKAAKAKAKAEPAPAPRY